MGQPRSNPYPALAASIGLHAAVLIAGLVAWPWLNPPVKLAQVVPVTLVTDDDQGSQKNAVEAPTPAPAATETPTPDAAPQAPAPQPTPLPVKAPTPAPAKPAPSKPAAAPTPAKTPPPAKPQKSLDLDALAASLATPTKANGGKTSSAQKGPNRAQTALKAQTSTGTGSVSSNGASASMVAELERMWIPDCDVAAVAQLNMTITFTLTANGQIVGGVAGVKSSGDTAGDDAARVASERAKRAVYSSTPFENLPRTDYGHPVSINFDARKACAQK